MQADRATESVSSRAAEWAALVAILLLAALLLVVCWDRHYVITSDGVSYVTAGVNLVAGRGYVNQFQGPPDTTFPPFYPILVGLVARLGLDPEFSGRLVSAAASLASIALVYVVGSALYSRRAGLLAAFIFTLMPIRLTARSGFPLQQAALSESLYVALTLAALAAWIAFARRGRLRAALAVGLLSGLAYLTRPEGIALLAAFVLVVLVQRGRALPRRIGVAALTLGVAALVASPYLVFLHRQTGRWSLSGKSGANMQIAALATAKVPWARMIRFDPTTGQARVSSIDSLIREYPALAMGRSLPHRWIHNVFETGNELAGQFTPIEVVLAGIGLLAVPWATRRLGLEIALLSTWAYLAGLAAFFFQPRSLFAAAPSVAVWAGSGLAWLGAYSAAPTRQGLPGQGWRARWGTAGLVALAVFILFAGRDLRVEITRAHSGPTDPHKLAGLWLRDHHLHGAVMSTSPATAFYAGERAVGLPYAPAAEVPRIGRVMRARWVVFTSYDIDGHPSLIRLARSGRSAPGMRVAAAERVGQGGMDWWVVWELGNPP